MAFKNGAIIDLLKVRGDCIKNMDWDKMREITSQINEMKNDNF